MSLQDNAKYTYLIIGLPGGRLAVTSQLWCAVYCARTKYICATYKSLVELSGTSEGRT